MSIAENIKKLRIENKMTQEEVAEKLKITRQAIFKYENGIVSNIPIDKIEDLARLFSVSPAALMGWQEPASDPDLIPLGHSRTFRVVNEGIACGEPGNGSKDDSDEETITFPDDIDADHLVRCRGDSMVPRYYDGDLVFVREQPQVENGQIAAVKIYEDGEVTGTALKKYYCKPDEARVILRSLNPLYDDMIYEGERMNDVLVVGLAVGLYRNEA